MATPGSTASVRSRRTPRPVPDLSPYETAPVPVAGIAVDYAAGSRIPPHRHARAQLLYAVRGVLTVMTGTGRWIVPPHRGVWLRAGAEHAVEMRGAVQMRSLFIDPQAVSDLPDEDGVIDISPLLRELIVAATQLPLDYDANSRAGRLMRCLLDELAALPRLPFYLPWPDDARIASVCAMVVDAQDVPVTAEAWARRLAMSPKTFHRHFLAATGVSFGRWRQHARLLHSLEDLAQGLPVLEIAFRHGYENQSAYAAAFKRLFGMPPSRFYRAETA
ncbi:MAG TPA: helix-turn-helix transcriptional regulator [Burkholderiaceae bacterium]|nr:helix-turn-helix transcriptional regulator [Burkholderiaceae bacterium]